MYNIFKKCKRKSCLLISWLSNLLIMTQILIGPTKPIMLHGFYRISISQKGRPLQMHGAAIRSTIISTFQLCLSGKVNLFCSEREKKRHHFKRQIDVMKTNCSPAECSSWRLQKAQRTMTNANIRWTNGQRPDRGCRLNVDHLFMLMPVSEPL